jgi:hypothetical protein
MAEKEGEGSRVILDRENSLFDTGLKFDSLFDIG